MYRIAYLCVISVLAVMLLYSRASCDDITEDIYESPVANAGLVQVFLSTKGKYVRTTPLKLHSYEVRDAGKTLTVYVDVSFASDDMDKIDLQMKQYVVDTPGAPPQVTAKSLTWMTPFAVEVNLIGPTGQSIGKQRQSNIDSSGKPRGLLLNEKTNLAFSFPLTLAITDNDVKKYKVTIESNYSVKTAKAQSAAFQVVALDSIKALEKVLGKKPGEQLGAEDYISRDAVQSIAKTGLLKRSLKLINATEKDEQLLLSLLQSSLTRNVDLSGSNLTALPAKLTIWTPDIGKLEITPTSKNFEEYEKEIKQSSKSKYRNIAESLSDEATTNSDFEKWYNKRHDKHTDDGSMSGSTEGEANVFDFVSGSASGSASYNFKKTWDELNLNSGEKSKYSTMHKKLQNKSDVTSAIDTNFESFWKGNNKLVDYVAKSLTLSVVKDLSSASSEITDILRLTVTGSATQTYKTTEVELKSAILLTDAVRQLQMEVAESKTNFEVLATATVTIDGSLDTSNPKAVTFKDGTRHTGVFGFQANKQPSGPFSLYIILDDALVSRLGGSVTKDNTEIIFGVPELVSGHLHAFRNNIAKTGDGKWYFEVFFRSTKANDEAQAWGGNIEMTFYILNKGK